jgi:cardiolipin-specific phospholipase
MAAQSSNTSSDHHASSSRSQQSPIATHQEKEAAAQQMRGSFFPLGYKEAFGQWWAGLAPAQTERTVLSFLPFIQKPPVESISAPPSTCTSSTDIRSSDGDSDLVKVGSMQDPYGVRKWATTLVKLSGKDRSLNEFSVERVGEDVENNLVMLHGYGAGLGFFYKNFEPLSRLPGWRLYALDMLGMGRSSRPPFKIHAKDREGKIAEAENWFIDALEEWRIQRKIEKFTLLGHSLGGYMAVAYALKYPGRLNKLILASPVGIPEDPDAVNAELPDPDISTIANEVTQDQDIVANPNKTKRDAVEAQAPRRKMPKWFTYLWDANVSPFSLVRLSGPFGPSLVSGWTSRRFSRLPPVESQALHDYSYSLFRQRGSGEYALAYILAPGAFARSPLIRRIHGVGRQLLTEHNSPTPDSTKPQAGEKRENGIPVVLMYGSQDWMDISGGFASEQKINSVTREAMRNKPTEERKKDNGDAKVVVIKNAGHHLYLDGYVFGQKADAKLS